MVFELPEQLIAASPGGPLRFVDSETQRENVLVSADLFRCRHSIRTTLGDF